MGEDDLEQKDEYLSMDTTLEPERELDMAEEDIRHKSMEEAEESNANLPDLQVTLKKMFPTCGIKLIDRVTQAIMMSRVHYDSFTIGIRATVNSIVYAWDIKKDGIPDVQMIFDLVKAAYSVGLNGDGREDAIVIAGAAREEEISKLSQQVGLPY